MKLTLVPQGGLCNRMNTILSAIALNQANNFKYEINIYWEKSHDCYVHFDELFEPLQIKNITIHPLKDFHLKSGGKRTLFLPNLFRIFKFDASYNGNKISNLHIEELINNKKDVYISACNRFCLYEIQESIGNYFKPNQDIEKRIQAITQQFTDSTIGIHIRRTDNILAIKNNPISKFITLIEKELTINSNTKFYIASDDVNVKQELANKFPNKIIQNNWELRRDTENGMKDAVAELYCLGRTKKIIGCGHSTYSLMASWLYNSPIIL